MKFQQIRSATAIVTYGDIRFLVDPWLAPKDSWPPLRNSPNPTLRCPIHELPLPIEKILDVDAVIATHLHFDHFDETAIQLIPKSTPLFAQDETDMESLKSKGFINVTPLQGKGVVFKGVTLFKTGCYHAPPGLKDTVYAKSSVRGEACGIIFRHPDEAHKLYLAGDTIWCNDVAMAIRHHTPDIIVVNAAQATFVSFGRIIMGLEDIEHVLAAAPQATIIASHMDNVGHETLWRNDIRAFAEQHSLQQRLLVPEDGETCVF